MFPLTLNEQLPIDRNSKILDIGCGLGQNLRELVKRGYINSIGIDIASDAVNFCKKNNLNAELIEDILKYDSTEGRFDFIIMTHVLEHLNKDKIIPTLKHIKENLLAENGTLYLAVPNAQSNTGAYWFFEDFTHNFLFTTGSLIYVLKAAGFEDFKFLDTYKLNESSLIKRIIRKLLLKYYKEKIQFWNNITKSYYHAPSPVIFSYELILITKNTKSYKC
jgi:SAM-dependent methyltransferase